MGITIDSIKDNEQFEYEGDVNITGGGIGKNATVIITDGNLTIAGDVGNGSEISLKQKQTNSVVISNGIFTSNNVSIFNNVNNGKYLTIKGSVGDNVIFNSHNADFNIVGSIGKGCHFTTHNGDIVTGYVGASSSLKSHNGSIKSADVGDHVSLNTHNGNVKAGKMGEYSSGISHNGDVKVLSAPKSAELKTHNGDVYENGVKRKKPKSNYGSSITQINGMTFIGGGSGRTIVNGVDVTEYINSQKSNQQQSSKPPVRFSKN
ncbi:MAG: hypothetical protein A3F13_04935 [Gammaproteobacteria bacterium RIFCSPHIGHO2_12_FULL_40_19]|nr:MAG: hypothetical protein A3F13_04935 [Gammaproteobacteria bacterium RIFCSPHIGHO2_12_FULL_40_19]HLB41999.1 hypothetical protein [Gammaproteobacteria bacterium]